MQYCKIAIMVMVVTLSACAVVSGDNNSLNFIAADRTAGPQENGSKKQQLTRAVPPQPQRPTSAVPPQQNTGLGLVHMGDGRYCPEESVSRQKPVWARPGAHPFTGDVELGVDFLPVPKEVKVAWKREMGHPTYRTLTAGEVVCGMLYSHQNDEDPHHLWMSVQIGNWVNEPGAYNGAKVVSIRYGGYIWDLIIPDVCENVSFQIRKEVNEPAKPVVEKKSTADSVTDSFFIRVVPWEEGSIPDNLLGEIYEVMATESNATYPFENGAVSRDYGPRLFESWENGGATTISQPITLQVSYPGSKGWETVTVRPGEHPEFPELTFFEVTVDRSAAAQRESYAGVIADQAPVGCSIVYPLKNGDGNRLLDMRPPSGSKNRSELAIAADTDEPGWNLHLIIDCPKNLPL